MKNFTARLTSAFVFVASVFTAQPLVAQSNEIILRSSDGSANLRGTFLDFTDGFYTIDTDLGRFRVSASRMTCEGAACPEIKQSEANITFVGSDTVGLGLMPLLITGFANSQGAEAELSIGSGSGEMLASVIGDQGFGDKIGDYLVSSRTSSSAFAGLLNNTAQIGMSSRRITRQEARDLRASGAGNMVSVDNEHVVAVDSLVVIVNPQNPVSVLSTDQLAGIYTGQITNWNQVGGPDGPIKAFARAQDSGTQGIFQNAVFGNIAATLLPDMTIVNDDNEMASNVNADANAIGFVAFAFQRGAKALNLTNQCGITVSPTTFSAKTEEYPMGRRLYLYNRSDNLAEDAQEFLNYALSQEADGVIAKSGFIDLGIERLSQDFTGDRMQQIILNTKDQFELGLMRELLVEMLQWDRLSTTLRFQSGSSALDKKAQNDVARLIDYLETLPLGTEVAVVGFTDSDGAFEGNRSLSNKRALQVANEINATSTGRLGNIQFVAKGFGELSPAACNTDADGKAINRRVEIWLRSPGG